MATRHEEHLTINSVKSLGIVKEDRPSIWERRVKPTKVFKSVEATKNMRNAASRYKYKLIRMQKMG